MGNTPDHPHAERSPQTDATSRPPPPNIAIEELEVWLQRHYFFVAERRWIAYGAAEAILGSLVDIVEGIPVTSRSLVACAFPPATMAVMLIVLFTLLLWKWPFAVRIQQWGSIAVVGLLGLAATLVTVNIFVASVELEEVCGYLLLISSILITIFSVLDIIAWLLMLFPFLREKLGLRPVSLSTALARLRRDAHVPPSIRTEEMATLFVPTYDDDANTDRFCRLVQSMTDNTQFLFISHNKIAMEMAQQLIGVTMQEQGVSRIVAVDMESALSMADA